MRKAFRAAVLFMLTALSYAYAAEDARLDVVERLYQNYAWEAQPSISKRTAFLDESSSVLEKYLTTSLSRLLLMDRKCVKRTREICQLDFLPLWNSQDPEGATFRIMNISPSNTASVAITYPGQKPQTLAFDLVQTDAGWRINNIRSQTPKWSLRKILVESR